MWNTEVDGSGSKLALQGARLEAILLVLAHSSASPVCGKYLPLELSGLDLPEMLLEDLGMFHVSLFSVKFTDISLLL